MAPVMTASPHFDIELLPATFGATVLNVRLAALSEEAFRSLYATWLDRGLLIVPDQHLTEGEQIAFARRFGPLEIELGVLTNLLPDGSIRRFDDEADDLIKVFRGNMAWHQDSTYMSVQAKGAVFSAVTVPDGYVTSFADMEAAYDALDPDERDELNGLSAFHSLVRSQAKVGHVQGAGSAYDGYGMNVAEPPLRPLVKVHPETGRKSLSIGRHAYALSDRDEAESDSLLNALRERSCQPPRIWDHIWSPGDVVIWDNRRLMHRAGPWNMSIKRVMWHSRIAGDPRSEGV
jgi:alpha-ketoglutarate-dependent taurine dioxygenase